MYFWKSRPNWKPTVSVSDIPSPNLTYQRFQHSYIVTRDLSHNEEVWISISYLIKINWIINSLTYSSSTSILYNYTNQCLEAYLQVPRIRCSPAPVNLTLGYTRHLSHGLGCITFKLKINSIRTISTSIHLKTIGYRAGDEGGRGNLSKEFWK